MSTEVAADPGQRLWGGEIADESVTNNNVNALRGFNDRVEAVMLYAYGRLTTARKR